MKSNGTGLYRPHIYELDPLRALTAITVVGVHTLAFTAWLYKTSAEAQIHYGVLDAIHWTRNVFLFVTALVLTYVYYGKPFAARRFWWKRGVGVLLPYCVWSMAYTWFGNPSSHSTFLQTALLDIVTGSASYQLYYIMLTLQLYLVLPLFFWVLRRIARHPWWALTVSFVLELGMMYVSFVYLQQGNLVSSSLRPYLNAFQDRFLLSYQFYLVLGGLAAMHLDGARAFLARHGKAMAGAFIAGLAIALAAYLVQFQVYGLDLPTASTPLQPAIMVYSVGVILFLCWLGFRWASRTGGDGHPAGYRFWSLLSDASFGIYLVQAFVLTALFERVLPQMPSAWPAGLRIFIVWMLAASSSTAISIVLLYIPIASRLVGRPVRWHSPRPAVAARQRTESHWTHEGKVES